MRDGFHWSSGISRSGNDIRQQIALQRRDLVTQLQFPFFQPLDLNHVRHCALGQGLDGIVKVAVLIFQLRDSFAQFILLTHECFSRFCWQLLHPDKNRSAGNDTPLSPQFPDSPLITSAIAEKGTSRYDFCGRVPAVFAKDPRCHQLAGV